MRYPTLLLTWLLLGTAVLAIGCATTGSDGDEISSIPWNRPADWEGTGALSGFTPPGSQGY